MTTINNPTKNDAPQSTTNNHTSHDPLAYFSGKNYTPPISQTDMTVQLGRQSYYCGDFPQVKPEDSEAMKACLQVKLQSVARATKYDKEVSSFLSSDVFSVGYMEAKARLLALKAGNDLLRIRKDFLLPAVEKYIEVEKESMELSFEVKDDFRAALKEHRIIQAIQQMDSLIKKQGLVRQLFKDGENFALGAILKEPVFITGITEDFRILMTQQITKMRDAVKFSDNQYLKEAISKSELFFKIALYHCLVSSGLAVIFQAPTTSALISKNLLEIDQLIASIQTYQNSKRHQDDLAMTPTNYA